MQIQLRHTKLQNDQILIREREKRNRTNTPRTTWGTASCQFRTGKLIWNLPLKDRACLPILKTLCYMFLLMKTDGSENPPSRLIFCCCRYFLYVFYLYFVVVVLCLFFNKVERSRWCYKSFCFAEREVKGKGYEKRNVNVSS